MEILKKYNAFVEVVLPLSLPKLYTYAIPEVLENEIQIGKRVEVQFGKQKLYAALVYAIHQQPPTEYIPKEILNVIDELPIVTPTQLKLWNWIANYYICTLGDVMQAAFGLAQPGSLHWVAGVRAPRGDRMFKGTTRMRRGRIDRQPARSCRRRPGASSLHGHPDTSSRARARASYQR